jgi:hypothetical protein
MESAGTLPHLTIVKKVAIHAKAARRGPAKRTILRHAVPRMSAPARATPVSCNSQMSWCHDSMRYALLSLSASRITASEKTLRLDLDHFGACGTTDLCTGAVLPTTHPAPTQCGPPPPAALRARPHRSHAAARMARSRGFCSTPWDRVAPPRATIITPTRRMPIVSRGHWLVTVLWVSLRRAGEESHADFRIIAEGFY